VIAKRIEIPVDPIGFHSIQRRFEIPDVCAVSLMRGLRQCRSDDIFNSTFPFDCKSDSCSCAFSEECSSISSEYSDSDFEEEEVFEFEPVDFQSDPQTELSIDFFLDDAMTLQTDETRYTIDPRSLERLHGSKIRELRFLLADWLFSVSYLYPTSTETVFQSISLLDRYLSNRAIPYSKLQLICCSCLWISAKVDLHVEDSLDPLFRCCHGKYVKGDFVRSEAEILCAIDYEIHPVTSYFFLRRFLDMIRPEAKIELLALFICESTVFLFDVSGYRPSQIAFCAIASACIQFGMGEQLCGLADFVRSFRREEVLMCFGLVLKAARSVARKEQCFLMRKFAARAVEGTEQSGADLIKSVEFGNDLVRALAALFDNFE
jgi:hypothetical protein